jgi:aconitate hydratase
VDLAAMRDAMAAMGGDPARINPLVPAELVIDHSVQVDAFGTRDAFQINAEREFERNRERYAFLRWGQGALDRFSVVPPDTGIVHQVNLEYLSRVVFVDDEPRPEFRPPGRDGGSRRDGRADGGSRLPRAYPDTLVGTDSHTTMVNGLGVLGWGVGGIEAEAAMLGQPLSMLIPQVLGFRLHGALPEGATATDLVLTVTQMLRERGVVGMFVEFHGAGLAGLPIADRATIGNMSPEFGGTCAIFPIDAETLRYLRFTGRPPERIELVEAYAREQGLWHDEDSPEPAFSDTLELDLGEVEPSLAGPKRPQDRVALTHARDSFRRALGGYVQDYDWRDESSAESFPSSDPPANGSDAAKPDDGGPSYVDEAARATASAQAAPGAAMGSGGGSGGAGDGGAGGVATGTRDAAPCTLADGTEVVLDHGHVVIAAITSCTNTSNPSVMIGAGILARNAVARGLERKPWVKTSLAPGSKVVTEYLDRAQLTEPLEAGLQPGGLRLHDLHRQLGPAAGGGVERGQRQRPGGGVGAVGQPQLRGADQPGREDELPGVAAAVRGLRAGGDDGHRHRQRTPRPRRAGRGGVPARHLARRARGGPDDRAGGPVGHVPQELRRGVRGRRALEDA